MESSYKFAISLFTLLVAFTELTGIHKIRESETFSTFFNFLLFPYRCAPFFCYEIKFIFVHICLRTHFDDRSSIVSGTHRTHGDELVTVVHHRDQQVQQHDDVDQGEASEHDQPPEPEYWGYILLFFFTLFFGFGVT